MCLFATTGYIELQHGVLASAKKESMSNCICQFAKTMVVFVCNMACV
jgi:hypothetical protein